MESRYENYKVHLTGFFQMEDMENNEKESLLKEDRILGKIVCIVTS